MKTETREATCASARGTNFNPPLKFSFKVSLLENVEDFEKNGKPLTAEEQMKVRNAEAVTRERQAEQNRLLDSMGVEKQDINNNEQIRLREFVKLLKANGFSEEDARAQAVKTLGIEFAE
jgi:hypothetical protein